MKYETYKTKKGTVLPLINLKNKGYMQVAHRLVWFTEEVPNYRTSTEFLKLTEDETIARVTVEILSTDRNIHGVYDVLKSVTATKREDKKGFSDHTEKAETGALGRALAILGFGTQFAIADLEEGDRLADSPVVSPTEVSASGSTPTETSTVETKTKPKAWTRSKPAAPTKSSEEIL